MGLFKSILGNKEENKFVENDEKIRAYRKCEHLAFELCRIDIATHQLCEQLEQDNPDKTGDECYQMACEIFEDEKLKAVTEALMISLSETHQKEHEYNVNALVNGEELLWKPIGFDLFMSDVCEGLSDESGIDFCVKTIFEESEELVEGLSKERIRKEIVDSFEKYCNYIEFLDGPDTYDFSDKNAEFIPVCLACGSLLGDGIYDECVACSEIPMKFWLESGDESEKYCAQCGAKVESDAKFCSKCGSAV